MRVSTRLTREDWLEIGLRLLGASGERALTIDCLCQATGRTKGSFYHHFHSHDGFINALLEYWQSEYTDRIIAVVNQLERPIAQRRELDRLAASVDSRVEKAIRNWSGVDERVRQILKQVDDKRIKYLTGLIAELGQFDETTAFELAIIEYSAFLGLQYLFPNTDSDWMEHLITRVTQIISSSYCCNRRE